MRKGRTIFQWSVALLLALCILAPVPSSAQGIQIFVKVDSIVGESKDASHKDWIDAFSYGDGVSQGYNPAYSSPGGSAAMRADFAPVTIVKQIDAASPKLREAVAMGKHFKQVTIQLYEGQFKFFEVLLGEAMISSVQSVMPDLASVPTLMAASSPSVMVLQERVSFVFGSIKWTYTKQKPDGSGGGIVTGGWDLQRNRAQ